jgi:cytochrome bd-type quinol oxidase subunit 2
MIEMPLKLSVIWICVMLTYLLGDVLRIFSGDFKAGEMGSKGGRPMTQNMLLGIAILMVIPILMVFLSVTLNQPVNRWVNIIVAAFFFLFNLVGLPTYPSLYDKFLIAVSLAFNVVTVRYAWNWV